jgi:hypothetical protein
LLFDLKYLNALVLGICNVQMIFGFDPHPRWFIKLARVFPSSSVLVEDLPVAVEDIDYIEINIAHIDVLLGVDSQTIVNADLRKPYLSAEVSAEIEDLKAGVAWVENEDFIRDETIFEGDLKSPGVFPPQRFPK